MNTQPAHDPATGDLRGCTEAVAMPGDINIGNIPNSDTPTDDMRGHEPLAAADPQSDKTGMIISGVAVAALIGGLGIFSYATGTWDSGPAKPAPVVVAANVVAPPSPVAAPQPAVVPAPVPSATVEGPSAPVAPVVKRPAASKPAARLLPQRAIAPPEIMPVPTTVAPLEAAPITPAPPAIEPAPPIQAVPDQPAAATPDPQTPPTPQ